MARVRGDNDQRYALRASFVDENGDVISTDTITISSTATDPRISATQISNWDTAYGWGDHSTEGYLTAIPANYAPALATELSNTVDLDDLNADEVGFYYQRSNSDTTGNNYPNNRAGSLLVQRSTDNATQMYITYDGSNTDLFFRANYTSGYGTWRKAWDDSDFSATQITNWDSAYADTSTATTSFTGSKIAKRDSAGNCQFRDLYVDRNDGTGAIYFQNDGSRYIYYNGSSYTFNGVPLTAASGTSAFGNLTTTGTITSAGYIMCGTTASSPVGFTVNDGGGNANIVFNHFNNAVQTAGMNTARISHNTDNTTASALSFQTGSGGVGPSTRMQIRDTYVTVTGELRATGNVLAYYSDERLKEPVGAIEEPLESVKAIRTFYYVPNEKARELGYTSTEREVGVSAQSVQAVMPEAVKPAPVDEEYLTVQYERLVPLLIESIKTLADKVEGLQEQINAIQ